MEALVAVVVDGPKGPAGALVPKPTFDGFLGEPAPIIVFYNLSGQLPDDLDFEPAADWPEELRRQLPHWRDRRPSRKALPGNVTGFVDDAKLGSARLRVKGVGIWSCDLHMEKRGWLTHFAVYGKDGVIFAGEFEKATPVLSGNGFSMGLRIQEFLPASFAKERWRIQE